MAEIAINRNPHDLFEQSLAEGHWGDAEAIARRQLARGDGDAQAHAWAVLALARCALARGDGDGVRRWLDRAARIATPDADFCDHRASLLLEAGDIAEALALFERSAAD